MSPSRISILLLVAVLVALAATAQPVRAADDAAPCGSAISLDLCPADLDPSEPGARCALTWTPRRGCLRNLPTRAPAIVCAPLVDAIGFDCDLTP